MSDQNLDITLVDSNYNEPLQLIYFDDNKQMKIGEKAINFVKSLTSQVREFGIISLVGNYRTGKSYFISQVLLQKPKAFTIGNTVNACTRGLWIWPQMIKVHDKVKNETKHCLVVDTEGIGNTEEGQQHDTKIFLIALLISSQLIYNSVGAINENALMNLQLVVKLSKHLNSQSESQFKEVVKQFPSFLWILRDFTLKLQDEFGMSITPKQYLEQALAQQKGMSDMIEQKNRIRRQITQFFRERDCFPMVRPTENEKDLQNLNNIPFLSLRPEFQEQIKLVRNKIFSSIKFKYFNGNTVTPGIFMDMVQSFCDAINQGNIPTVQNSWQFICQSARRQIQDELTSDVEKEVNQIDQAKIEDFEELEKTLDLLKSKYEEEYLKKSSVQNEMIDSPTNRKQQEEFQSQIESIIIKKKSQIEVKIKEKLSKQFEDNVNEMNKQFQNQQFDSLSELILQLDSQKIQFDSKFKNSEVLKKQAYENLYQHLKQIATDFDAEKTQKYNLKFQQMQSMNEQYQQDITQIKKDLFDQNQSNQQIISNLQSTINKQKQQIVDLNENNSKISQLLTQSQQQQEDTKYYYKQKADQQKQYYEEQIQQQDYIIQDLKDKICQYEVNENQRKLDQDKKDSQIKKGWNLMQQQNEEINQEVVRLNQEVLNLTNLLKGSATLYKYKTQEHLKNNLNMNIKYNADHFLKDWQIEKEQLEIAIKETKKEISEHRSIHREILKQLKDVSNNKQGLKDQQSQFLLKKHKILEESIQSNELRCKELEDLVEKLKNFYKLVKYASNMECKICLKNFNVNDFVSHLNLCKEQNQFKIEVFPLFGKQFQFSVRVSLQSQNLNHEITKDISEFQTLANLLETYLPEEKIPELVKIYRNIDNLKSLEEKKLIQSLKQLIEFFFSQHDIRDLREFGQFLGPELQSYLIRPNLDISYNTTINNTSANLNNNSYIAAQQDSPNTTTEQLLRESLMIRVTEFCNQAQNNNNVLLQQKSQQLQQQQPSFNQNNQNILNQLNFSKQQQKNDKENLPEFAPDNKVFKSNFNDDSPHFGLQQQQNLEYQDELDMAPTFIPQISEKNCQQQQQQEQQQQQQQLQNIDFAQDPVKAAEVAAQEQQILKQSLQNINQFTEALRGSFMLNNQQQLA